MAVEPSRHLFSVEQYERMVETGVLTEDDRVELIEGEILEMPPLSPGHSTVVWRLARHFRELEASDRAVVRVQDAIRISGQHGVPEAWLVNLPEELVERYTDPRPEGYGDVAVHRRGDTLSPTAFPEVELRVDDLLP